MLLGCGLFSGAALPAHPAQAQEFSAELLSTAPAATTIPVAKIYVAHRKVRIESSDLPGDILIVDTAIPAAYLVRPAQRVFMDAKQSSRLTRLFVPLDPADPCRQWETMAEVAGITDSGQWRCVAKGSEIVNGRNTLKFTVSSPHDHGTGWIDARLKFPVQIQTEDGSVLALEDITEAPQPAERFKIPGSYRKFDPGTVIELMKRSDIWVAPPDNPGARVRR